MEPRSRRARGGAGSRPCGRARRARRAGRSRRSGAIAGELVAQLLRERHLRAPAAAACSRRRASRTSRGRRPRRPGGRGRRARSGCARRTIPAARCAFGRPASAASSPYVTTSPRRHAPQRLGRRRAGTPSQPSSSIDVVEGSSPRSTRRAKSARVRTSRSRYVDREGGGRPSRGLRRPRARIGAARGAAAGRPSSQISPTPQPRAS